jgi:phage shock protein A
MSLWTRIVNVFKASAHGTLDKVENIENMSNQTLREYREGITKAKTAMADSIGQMRNLEADHAADKQKMGEYDSKIRATHAQMQKCLAQAEQYGVDTPNGIAKTNEADKYRSYMGTLAEQQVHLTRKIESDAKNLASQMEGVEQLKKRFTDMERQYKEAEARQKSLISRSRSVEAEQSINKALDSTKLNDPNSDFARLEAKVRRDEGRLAGTREIESGSNIEYEIDRLAISSEAEARIAMLTGYSPDDQPSMITKD